MAQEKKVELWVAGSWVLSIMPYTTQYQSAPAGDWYADTYVWWDRSGWSWIYRQHLGK